MPATPIHPALRDTDRPAYSRFVAALSRIANRVSDAIVAANDMDRRGS